MAKVVFTCNKCGAKGEAGETMTVPRNWIDMAAETIAGDPACCDISSSDASAIAEVVATFAEPLVSLLRESKREHYHCDDGWYCCGKCLCRCSSTAKDHEHFLEDCWPASHGGEAARVGGVCNCGADAWNRRVDAALSGWPEPTHAP